MYSISVKPIYKKPAEVDLPEYKPEYTPEKPTYKVPAEELPVEHQQAQEAYSSAARDYYQKQQQSAEQQKQFNTAVQAPESAGYTDEQLTQMKQKLEESKSIEAQSLQAYKAAEQSYKDISGSKGKTSAIEQVATHEAQKTENMTRQDVTKQVNKMKKSAKNTADFVAMIKEASDQLINRDDKSSVRYFLEDALDTLNNPDNPTAQELGELEKLFIDLKTQQALAQKDVFNIVDDQRKNIRYKYKKNVKPLTDQEKQMQTKLQEIYDFEARPGKAGEKAFAQAKDAKEKQAVGRPVYEFRVKNSSSEDRPRVYTEFSRDLLARNVVATPDDIAHFFDKKFYTDRVVNDLDNLNVFALKTNAKGEDLPTTYLQDFIKFIKNTLSELFSDWQNFNATKLETVNSQIQKKQTDITKLKKNISAEKDKQRSFQFKDQLNKAQADVNNMTAEGRMRSELNRMAKELNLGGFNVKIGGKEIRYFESEPEPTEEASEQQ